MTKIVKKKNNKKKIGHAHQNLFWATPPQLCQNDQEVKLHQVRMSLN